MRAVPARARAQIGAHAGRGAGATNGVSEAGTGRRRCTIHSSYAPRRPRPSARPQREHRARGHGVGKIVLMASPRAPRRRTVPTHFADLVVTNARPAPSALGSRDRRAVLRAPGGPPFDWSEVDVYMGDERFVPPHHPDRTSTWCTTCCSEQCSPRSFHSIYRAGPIADAADTCRRTRSRGVTDRSRPPRARSRRSHASLFPGTPALEVKDRFVVINEDADHPHPRLTFTYPAIAKRAASSSRWPAKRSATDAAHRER